MPEHPVQQPKPGRSARARCSRRSPRPLHSRWPRPRSYTTYARATSSGAHSEGQNRRSLDETTRRACARIAPRPRRGPRSHDRREENGQQDQALDTGTCGKPDRTERQRLHPQRLALDRDGNRVQREHRGRNVRVLRQDLRRVDEARHRQVQGHDEHAPERRHEPSDHRYRGIAPRTMSTELITFTIMYEVWTEPASQAGEISTG